MLTAAMNGRMHSEQRVESGRQRERNGKEPGNWRGLVGCGLELTEMHRDRRPEKVAMETTEKLENQHRLRKRGGQGGIRKHTLRNEEK